MIQEISLQDPAVFKTIMAMLCIFVGCFIRSTIGFGLAVVSAPLLYQISHAYVPGPIILIALLLSLINALTFKSKLSLQGLGLAVLGRIPGSLCGAMLLLFIHGKALSVLIGVIVLVAVGISLLPIKIQPNPFRLTIAGFFSGLFGTSASIGGPPMALLLQHQEANTIRANLSAYFLISCVISLAILIPLGHFGMEHLLISLPLLPAGLAGYAVAMRAIKIIPTHSVRMASLTICTISGVTAIVSAFLD
ncbi:hypothetical protein TDB9533_02760 [Thalassocella blandensis]|nr:hypothetical protein TDB9533_02760 [Thalassocella blandensis]